MARSDLTLSDYRAEAEDLLGLEATDNDLEDSTILIAADKYIKFYRSFEVLGFKEHGKVYTAVTSIPVAGYDLTAIPDIYDYTQGFRVYIGSVDPLNRYLPVPKNSYKIGYYIAGSTLFINRANAATDIVIEHQKKAVKIPRTTSDISTIVPDIDNAFEDMLTLHIVSRYYARSGDNPQAAEDALNDSRNLTIENFNVKRRNASTTI